MLAFPIVSRGRHLYPFPEQKGGKLSQKILITPLIMSKKDGRAIAFLKGKARKESLPST